MKTLVIINGVTGAIGMAALAKFSRDPNVTIYGLSRRGHSILSHTSNSPCGHLPDCTLLCTVGDSISKKKNCEKFAKSINPSCFGKIIYLHLAGVYPFDIDNTGRLCVSNDRDGDGVDDRVVDLTYNALFTMTQALLKLCLPMEVLICAGLSDKHEPKAHISWCTVIKKVKKRMKTFPKKATPVHFNVLNISSVICPNELFTRQFVFQNTNAHPLFWLTPEEVAERIESLTNKSYVVKSDFLEDDLYHPATYHSKNYYSDAPFTNRKIAELGIVKPFGFEFTDGKTLELGIRKQS